VGGQLGERIDTGAALSAFAEALRCPELRVVAIHCHFNGRIVSSLQLDAFVSALLSFADQLRERLGLAVEILDVGGNLTCPTVSPLTSRARRLAVALGCEPPPPRPESVLTIDDYVAGVVGRVESHFAALALPSPRVFVEPGRALTSNTQMLLCRAVTVREPDAMGVRWAVLDAGIHMAEPLGSEWHQLFPVSPRRGATPELHRLSGPSCMLSDQLYPAWRLPELAPGDGLAIMDTGAYFVAFSAPFSFPRPAIVMVDCACEQVLRRAETFEDLVELDGSWATRRRPDMADDDAVAPALAASEAG
jgi:diaminopimelate decarboxylase